MNLRSRTFSIDAVADSDEYRSSLENPSVPLSAANLRDFGIEGGVASDAGVSVNARSVLGYAPLYQAVSQISGDVAKLPMGVYQRTDRGRKLRSDHSLHRRINLYGMANEEISAWKFWRRLMVSALLWGNGWAYIDRNERGEVLGIYNLLPDRTTMSRYKGQLWCITEVGLEVEAIPASDVLHIEGLSIDGLAGENCLKLFREDFGIALARRRFTAKFFKNGMTAGGILSVPPTAKPEAIRKIQSKVQEKFSSVEESFKTIVLRDGYKWFSTQVDPEKAQLNDMDEQQARNVARMFNLRPSRLGVSGSASYNSSEMDLRDYYDGALSHWLIGIKAETNNKLLTEQEAKQQLYIDYNINALLWADAKTRSEIANSGILNGRFSPNETRAWENLDAYDGGDAYYRPLNVDYAGGQRSEDEPPEARSNDPLRRLLETEFRRAANRLAIKAERAKAFAPEAIRADKAAILSMLDPSLAVARASQDAAEAWLESIADDFSKEKADAESSRIIDTILETSK